MNKGCQRSVFIFLIVLMSLSLILPLVSYFWR